MFKLVVLSAFVAIALARPGYVGHLDDHVVYEAGVPAHQEEYVEIQEPTVAKVGAVVHSVPSAVSHHSSTVVHSKAHVVTPILAHSVKTHHVPVVKSYEAGPVVQAYEAAPVLKAYEAGPVVEAYESAPVLKAYDAGHILNAYEAGPVLKTYEAGPVLKSYEAAPFIQSYESAPVLKTFEAAPVAYGYDADEHYHHSY